MTLNFGSLIFISSPPICTFEAPSNMTTSVMILLGLCFHVVDKYITYKGSIFLPQSDK